MQSLAMSGCALEYASEQLKNEPAVVMRAVAQSGDALQYASRELRDSRDIVMEAVSKDWRSHPVSRGGSKR